MNLNDVEKNVECIITGINISDEATKTRLMELGFTEGAHVMVLKKSVFRKTLLVSLFSVHFTLKDELAKGVIIYYA